MIRVYGRPPRLFPDYPSVITLGMFDGVHRGHQAILAATRDLSESYRARSIVFTFDIHPRSVIDGVGPPAITSLEHRLLLFEQAGIHATCILSFHPSFAQLSAEAFIREWLLEGQGMCAIVVGRGAHLGRGGEGDVSLLRRLGSQYGFHIHEIEGVSYQGEEIRSTAIRQAVQNGDLERAAAMLGRPVSVLGTVTAGSGRGRLFGFPTLNLDPHHELHPPRGVYITRTRCGDTIWPSVTNIGHRPTLDAQSEADVLIESHLLGFNGSLYGQTVEVQFLVRLRDEQRFSDVSELVRQVKEDISQAQRWHESHPFSNFLVRRKLQEGEKEG